MSPNTINSNNLILMNIIILNNKLTNNDINTKWKKNANEFKNK